MRRGWVPVVAAAAMVWLAGCTGSDGPGLPSAVNSATASPSATAGDALSKELQFVACMRQQGIADMPDPIPGDNSGRSAVRYALDVLGKGSDDAFQAALDKCMNLLPAPDQPKPETSKELQAYMDFARCMREHGVADFPDPQPGADGGFSMWFVEESKASTNQFSTPENGTMTVNLTNAAVKAAFDACGTILTKGTK